jgi:hypothetical protein
MLQEQIPRSFVAVDMLNRWWPYVRHVSPDRSKLGRISRGGIARRLQNARAGRDTQTGLGRAC